MTSIGFYLLSSHENNLVDLVDMAHSDDTTISIFTTEGIYEKTQDRVNQDRLKWLPKRDESIRAYLRKVELECTDRIDAVFSFPLHQSLWSYVNFDPNCPVLLYIFNTNTWTRSLWSPSPSFFDYINLIWRKRILSIVDAVAVEYEPMRQNMIAKLGDTDVDVYTLPPILCDQRGDEYGQKEMLTISIPGKVSMNRRDYETVCGAFESLTPDECERVTLRLLGPPFGDEGEAMTEEFERLSDQGWNVDTYHDWLSLETFHKQLRTSDYVLAPMIKTIGEGLTAERYGSTKGTGSIRDAFQYGKPLILPNWFEVADSMTEAAIRYAGKSDLANQVRELSTQPDLVSQHQAAATEVAERYTLNEQRKRFYWLLSEVANASGREPRCRNHGSHLTQVPQ